MNEVVKLINEIELRNSVIEIIAKSCHSLILSSFDAKKDWETLALNSTCKLSVLPFAVTHPYYNQISIEELKKEFKIEKEFFIISNQFWIHKNHMLVFKSITAFIKKGFEYQFVFTGKEDDYRNPNYYNEILNYIEQNKLNNTVRLLGLIDRTKQLALMKHATAIIQPSLFEGWSTVVEDGKAMNQFVFVSDIPVHREQITENCCFFNPYDEMDLLDKLVNFLNQKPAIKQIDYSTNIKKFGEEFHEILKSTL